MPLRRLINEDCRLQRLPLTGKSRLPVKICHTSEELALMMSAPERPFAQRRTTAFGRSPLVCAVRWGNDRRRSYCRTHRHPVTWPLSLVVTKHSGHHFKCLCGYSFTTKAFVPYFRRVHPLDSSFYKPPLCRRQHRKEKIDRNYRVQVIGFCCRRSVFVSAAFQPRLFRDRPVRNAQLFFIDSLAN